MLNNTLIRNVLVSLLVALLAPVLLPVLLASPEFPFDTSAVIKIYLMAFALIFLAATFNELLRAKAQQINYDSAYAFNEEQDLDSDESREEGIVKWFNINKGYGFIIRDSGGEVFVHFRSIRGSGHRTLREGQRVKFSSVEGEKGLQAEDVSILTR
ncbi:MAG: cold-shock protein [Pseudomonadaceae bacterium]|nr:cold-shock protein [Pseudomonadaceae bacterium]